MIIKVLPGPYFKVTDTVSLGVHYQKLSQNIFPMMVESFIEKEEIMSKLFIIEQSQLKVLKINKDDLVSAVLSIIFNKEPQQMLMELYGGNA